MGLKDLQLKLQRKPSQYDNVVKQRSERANIEAGIAKSIVDKLYGHVIKSVNSDRSSVKLNMFEKAAISSGLNRISPGTKEYVDGMRHEDIKLLLDDILGCYTLEMLEEGLNKRAKR